MDTTPYPAHLKGIIDTLANQHDQARTYYDGIKLDELSPVHISADILELIYIPVHVVTNHSDYFFVHDDKIVYGGHIDAKGLNATVITDIVTLPDFINISIAIRTEDEDQLYMMLGDGDTIIRLMGQIMAGYQSLKENHPEKVTFDA